MKLLYFLLVAVELARGGPDVFSVYDDLLAFPQVSKLHIQSNDY